MNLKLNIMANLAARLWSALMSFAFVPLYIRFLGIEGYALLGVFTSLLALFSVLDLGLGLTVNREMARRSGDGQERSGARTLLWTLELIYWGVGATVGLTVIIAASFIARRWVNLEAIEPQEATSAIRLMGLAVLVRWPVALYLGALLGMRRQVLANVITTLGSTAAGGGAVLALWLVAPRPDVYFAWQVIAFGAQIAALRVAAWRQVPLADHRPKASWSVLRQSAAFSAGITGITLLSIVLTQVDKLLLTRLLPLSEFGYYTLAFSIAGLLGTAGTAVETAAFPALTSAVARNDRASEAALYHNSSQILAVLVVPVAIALALFSRELLTAYLGNPVAVAHAAPLLSVLALGNMGLAIVYLPLSLQLAHGWTSLSFYKNIVAVVVYLPALFLLVARYGAMGAAMSWLALTLGYVLIEVPVMHRRLLRGEMWRWYARDMGIPLAISLIVMGGGRIFLHLAASPWIAVVQVGGLGGMTLALIAVSLPRFRAALLVGLQAITHPLERRNARYKS